MEPEHPEPFSDGAQRSLERLMALGVLIEAGSRLAAENTRSNAQRVEQQSRDDSARERDEQKAARLARAEASRRERDWARFATDGDRLRDYLGALPFQELARHWGQAARHADTNPTAAVVLAAAQDKLRIRAPGLMDQYRQQRDNGLSRQEAMGNAVRHTWTGTAPARPHGGRPAAAGSLTQIGAELDREITMLAGKLDDIGTQRLLGSLEDGGWSAESLAYIETLLDRAASNRPDSNTQAGIPDDPVSPLDEHQAAVPAAAVQEGAANAAAVQPAQLAALSFSVPAEHSLTANPTEQSAHSLAPRTTPRRTR